MKVYLKKTIILTVCLIRVAKILRLDKMLHLIWEARKVPRQLVASLTLPENRPVKCGWVKRIPARICHLLTLEEPVALRQKAVTQAPLTGGIH